MLKKKKTAEDIKRNFESRERMFNALPDSSKLTIQAKKDS
jgi:hypothetical protein